MGLTTPHNLLMGQPAHQHLLHQLTAPPRQAIVPHLPQLPVGCSLLHNVLLRGAKFWYALMHFP